MTNQPPLYPDALEPAADIIWMNTRGENGVCDADRRTDDYAIIEAITSVAIKEYLTVAQPVVNSVEELDALPVGSVIIDKHGDVGLIDRNGTIEKCVQFAETIAMSIGYTAKHFLPARVLYRPEVIV